MHTEYLKVSAMLRVSTHDKTFFFENNLTSMRFSEFSSLFIASPTIRQNARKRNFKRAPIFFPPHSGLFARRLLINLNEINLNDVFKSPRAVKRVVKRRADRVD